MKGLVCLMVLGLFFVNCEKRVKFPPESIWFVMKNNTGVDLKDFELDTGTHKFSYQIFTAGYTFADWVKITGVQKVTYRYTDGKGQQVDVAGLERDLVPAMIGGTFRMSFEPDHSTQLSMDWPR